MKYYLVFSDKAPDGIVCRVTDLKHWVDASSIAVEVDESMLDETEQAIRHTLPIGQMNVLAKRKCVSQ